MEKLHYCCQCTDKTTGKTGCFAYDAKKHIPGERFEAISPIFPSLVEFFSYARKLGYTKQSFSDWSMTKC
jgi:hypothetical protein